MSFYWKKSAIQVFENHFLVFEKFVKSLWILKWKTCTNPACETLPIPQMYHSTHRDKIIYCLCLYYYVCAVLSTILAVTLPTFGDFSGEVCHAMKVTVAESNPDTGILTQQMFCISPMVVSYWALSTFNLYIYVFVRVCVHMCVCVYIYIIYVCICYFQALWS